jgi:hypothetical protein
VKEFVTLYCAAVEWCVHPLESKNYIHSSQHCVTFTHAIILCPFLPSFFPSSLPPSPPRSATAQGELWPPEQSASILRCDG